MKIFSAVFLATLIATPTQSFSANFFKGFKKDDRLAPFFTREIGLNIGDMFFSSKSFSKGAKAWPEGRLIYSFSTSVNRKNQKRFIKACREIELVSQVRCVERTDEDNYVYVFNGQANFSAVGMIGGEQPLSLYNWEKKYTIIHEIIHALGFAHEQSRSDRDQYVKIHWKNIVEGMEGNFFKDYDHEYNTAYDYDSVMHYGMYTFSKNREPTITPLDPSIKIGQRKHLSELDIKDLQEIYGKSNGNDDLEPILPDPNNPDPIDPESFHALAKNGKIEFKNIPIGISIFRISFLPEGVKNQIVFPLTEYFEKNFLTDETFDLSGVQKIEVRAYSQNDLIQTYIIKLH